MCTYIYVHNYMKPLTLISPSYHLHKNISFLWVPNEFWKKLHLCLCLIVITHFLGILTLTFLPHTIPIYTLGAYNFRGRGRTRMFAIPS